MFTPYFDCSRSGQGGGSVVVGGWLSTGEAWLKFEQEWRAVLSEFEAPYFHMKEFAHSRGAFENGWKDEREKRKRFMESLVKVINVNVIAGFGCLMNCSDFQEVDREYRVREHFGNEYAILGRICAAHVKAWLGSHRYEMPTEYVFEDGDPRGKLTWLMESDGFPAPIFKPSRDRIASDGSIVPGLIPLQAADFVAYETRKGWDDFGDAATIEELSRYRQSFRALGKVMAGAGYWGKCTADDLRGICNGKNVSKR